MPPVRWTLAAALILAVGCGRGASPETAPRAESVVRAAARIETEAPVSEGAPDMTPTAADGKIEKIVKSDKEWRDLLTEEQFRILRKKGTERAFTGEYWDNYAEGVYLCAGCGLELFSSETKFDSGTGWPSYTQPVSKERVAEKSDFSLFMKRTEVLCARCGGHLGHVFDDGPAPTGLRYCLNSAALRFKPKS